MSSASPTCAVLRQQVPPHWDVLPLAEVTDFQEGPGILAKDFHPTGVPLLRLRNIETPNVHLDGCNYLDPEKVEKRWPHFRLRKGDLLISTSASLGRVSVVSEAAVGSIPYTGIIRFRSASPKLDHKYLRAFLSSAGFVQQAEQMATGSVIKHFGPSHLRQMAIALPSVSEQVQIAGIFDVLDARIALLRETNTTLEAIAQALFKSWFIDFDPVRAKQQVLAPEGMDEATAALFPHDFAETDGRALPRGWRGCSIYDVAAVTYGAPFASSRFNTEGRGIGLVRIRDLKSELPGVFTEEIHPKGYLIQPGNIVVGMDGEFRAYLWGGEPSWLNQRLCVFSPINNASSAFVRMSIMPLLAAVEASETATTVIHLGKNDIDRFRVVMPDIPVLQAFGELVTPVYEKMVQCKQMASILASLRDTLLPRLISGQLRLPVAEELIEEFA